MADSLRATRMSRAKVSRLNEEDLKALEKALARENELIKRNDVDGLLDLYTEDAIVMTGGDLARGKEAIRQSYAKWFSLYDYWTLDRKVIEVVGIGDSVVELGTLSGNVIRKGGEASALRGKYILMWKRTRMGWKLHWEAELEDS